MAYQPDEGGRRAYQRPLDRVAEGVLLQQAATQIGQARRASGEAAEAIAAGRTRLRPELREKVSAAKERRARKDRA